MSGIKGVDKKKCHVESDQKRERVFLRKMFVWINDDRDSMTQWENLQKRYGLGLDRCFLCCRFLQSFYCAYFGNKTWLISMTHHSTFLVSCMHAWIIQNIKWDA